ncbi:Hypothetical protein R9X50_00672500 [Acrodontium crateriforme]|uniref:AMP-dependent synthetase/ligase domain-containing protein n=1 Tax=Acrodontium crateriforme TaxID=150365 RepID=A0AAQ3MDG8_9PEZI|nr:Hypothetical protein R9X50_00672500 [Acrodontium crateriforme]
MASLVERLDAQLAALLADWTHVTTLLAVAVVTLVVYPIIFPEEPDTHPLLLARQASVAPVRNRGESAVYRTPETPHGYPLTSGLNVKDDGAPRWAAGKNGDLRDVWREVLRGGTTGAGDKEIPKGLIMTVLGKQELIEHEIEDLTKEIAVIGQHLKSIGVNRVAIYLPNSIEYLMTLFACSFYGLTPILLPYNQPHPKVFELLSAVDADAIVCAAGNLPLETLASSCPKLRSLTWVVEKTSRHMDWNGVPDNAADRLTVSVWHNLVEENKSPAVALPSNETGDQPGDVVIVWQPVSADKKPEIITFTQSNIVSAVASLISALPLRQRFNSGDLIVPADTFTHSYVLCQTLAALYVHASIAVTSVAVAGIDIATATSCVSPTVIIVSAETLANRHETETAGISSTIQRVGKYSQDQTLNAGRMPTDNILFKLMAPGSTASGNTPGTLRLILTSERLGAGSPVLTSTMLSDLRLFIKARICYALTCPQVAGAVAQTNVFDYRRVDGRGYAPFGIPLSSVEIKLVSADDSKLDGNSPQGKLVVSGPAVSGKEVKLGVEAKIRDDLTLALV